MKKVGIGLILILVWFGLGLEKPLSASKKPGGDLNQLLKTYTQVLTLAEENYADSVDPETSIYRSILGMLQRLDPHSNFFDSKTYQQFREDQSGDFFGIGISVASVDGKPTVIATLPGTPAQRAGIRYGDLIQEIDGKSSQGMSQDQVVQKFRGPVGSVIHVGLEREGVPDLLKLSVTRGVIPQYSIPYAFLIRPGVAYVRIESFTETTEKELDDALAKIGSGVQGLVLDLRGNPGGALQAAIGVSDKFLHMGQEVLVTKGRMTTANNRYVVPKGTTESSYALVVLINSMSASAAEIVAGAIQDHDRGLIMGETSFGKGLVQTVFDLSQGTGVALTTAKWYTPSGRLIQRDYLRDSYYDYFSHRGQTPKESEICHTDSGREVYGGGGINPDFRFQDPVPSNSQILLSNTGYFLTFIRRYKVQHPEMTSFRVDDKVLGEFKDYLHTRGFPLDATAFLNDHEFIGRQLRYEFALSQGQIEEAQKVLLEGDAEVLKAVELFPEAKALFQHSQKVVAGQKNSKTMY
ncbi:MAG: S41 family peptidase [Terriglobia bacterium]